MATPLCERLLGRFARLTNRFRVWYRLPFLLAMPTIVGHRVNMREHNLLDTERDPSLLHPHGEAKPRDQRTADGSYNDLGCPWMGMAGARFGRNVPIADTYGEQPPELYEPNPRLVSRELLARADFVPVPHLNVLVRGVAAVHGARLAEPRRRRPDKAPHACRCRPATTGRLPSVTILRTSPDAPARSRGRGPARHLPQHRDALVGRLADLRLESRAPARWCAAIPRPARCCADGKLQLDADGHLPLDPRRNKIPNLELAGVNGNWWIGLSVMHTLFAREHNAIVDRLRIDYPDADGEWLFQKARLINAALIAKIHTVEWTPALHELAGRAAGHARQLVGRARRALCPRLRPARRAARSCPASRARPRITTRAPYAMTEEFTAVYRMHSLLPGRVLVPPPRGRRRDRQTRLPGGHRRQARAISTRKVPFDDVLYSLGTSHPGALVLHNYPECGLRKLPEEGRASCSSTSPRPTSCATASAACRATARSAAISACACRRPSPS